MFEFVFKLSYAAYGEYHEEINLLAQSAMLLLSWGSFVTLMHVLRELSC